MSRKGWRIEKKSELFKAHMMGAPALAGWEKAVAIGATIAFFILLLTGHWVEALVTLLVGAVFVTWRTRKKLAIGERYAEGKAKVE